MPLGIRQLLRDGKEIINVQCSWHVGSYLESNKCIKAARYADSKASRREGRHCQAEGLRGIASISDGNLLSVYAVYHAGTRHRPRSGECLWMPACVRATTCSLQSFHLATEGLFIALISGKGFPVRQSAHGLLQ